MDAFRRREMPAEAAAATSAVLEASSERRQQMLHGALKDLPVEDFAERALVLGALQVEFARLAAALSAEDLRPIADGACPVCGSPPMTSSVVGWPKAHNTRFCACSLCGTMWNVVRIKCVLCSSTEGIAYQTIEGQPDTVKAETCDQCESYVKILYQVNDHLLDPLSDDVATLGLDLLLKNEGWRRGGRNPFLLGY
jgi:FdhE protein